MASSGRDELDIQAAAAIAGRSAETVRRWVWSGRLKARKRGNRLLVARADLEALASELGSPPRMSLRDWAALAESTLRRFDGAGKSAGDLVLSDRRERSNSSEHAGR